MSLDFASVIIAFVSGLKFSIPKFNHQRTNLYNMTDKTFYLTREDLRKSESRSSQLHDGRTPGDANVSTLKVSI